MPLLVDPALPEGTLRSISQPPLAADHLTLRPWRAADADAVRSAFGCPDIQRWHVRRLDDRAETAEWIDQWAARWTAETAASWAVTDEADQVLGQVGLRTISLPESTASVSYWVVPGARGRSVAARAADALTRWAFGEIGFHRLAIQHSTANTASCRVAVRAGYSLEGTLRQAIKHADGWHDWHLHGRLRTD
ncbi:GNAT family N-acetyltransferase [Kribbella sp. NPDC051137]|uniref:GNAT family N-acetyltransferase n=1 Tax=Kribbella sp. NPDC051137 TaxID=3155045 RepID=UPI002F4F6AC4